MKNSAVHTHCPVCTHSGGKIWGRHGEFSLVRCAGCSFIFVREKMPADFYEKFYQQQVAGAAAGGKPASADKFRDPLQKISTLGLSGKKVLDVGCGHGEFLDLAKEAGFSATGIDLDTTRVAGCQARGLRAFCGQLPLPELAGETFDLIWCSHIIEHIDNPHSFLDAVETHLKPGGIIAILLPNCGGLAARICRTHFRFVIPPEHLSYYNPRSLRTLAERRGWVAENIFTRDAGWALKDIVAYFLKLKFLRAPRPLVGDKPFSVELAAASSESEPQTAQTSLGFAARISHAAAPLMQLFGGDELIGFFRKPLPTSREVSA